MITRRSLRPRHERLALRARTRRRSPRASTASSRGTDISLVIRRDRDGTQQGISVARVFGDALELHGEVARRHALVGGAVHVHEQAQRRRGALSRRRWTRRRADARRSREPRARASRPARARTPRYAPLQMARNYAFVRVDLPFDKNRRRADRDHESARRLVASCARRYTRKLRAERERLPHRHRVRRRARQRARATCRCAASTTGGRALLLLEWTTMDEPTTEAGRLPDVGDHRDPERDCGRRSTARSSRRDAGVWAVCFVALHRRCSSSARDRTASAV